jgi:hypothetical protein
MSIITISSHLKKIFERVIQYNGGHLLNSMSPPRKTGSQRPWRTELCPNCQWEDNAMVVEGGPIYAISC